MKGPANNWLDLTRPAASVLHVAGVGATIRVCRLRPKWTAGLSLQERASQLNQGPLGGRARGTVPGADLCAVHICAYNAFVSFEWDPRKAASNLLKHHVDFADAVGGLRGPTSVYDRRTASQRGTIRYAWPRPARACLSCSLVATRRSDSCDIGSKSAARGVAPVRRGNVMRKQYDFGQGKRGPVLPVSKAKTRITIRLDDDLLDWFRSQVHAAGGGNYQTLINDALRRLMETEMAAEPLESVVRRVVREELRGAKRRAS
jgi:uncharacterized protein (DUF4415 family)